VPMMLLLTLVAIIGGTLLLHKFVAPPGARVVIEFKAGRASVTRGTLSFQTLRFVEDVLKQNAAPNGSVAILPNGNLWFSPAIPVSAHQQLRNVLMP
jgi:hypothetical protein